MFVKTIFTNLAVLSAFLTTVNSAVISYDAKAKHAEDSVQAVSSDNLFDSPSQDINPTPTNEEVIASKQHLHMAEARATGEVFAEVTTTLYSASKPPQTTYSGTIHTSIPFTAQNPVSTANVSATTSVSETINPSTYTAALLAHATDGANSENTNGVNGVTLYSSQDLFQPISVEEPPSIFPRMDLRVDIPKSVSLENPLHTNKFYSNLLLADQCAPVFAQPYTLWYSRSKDFPGMGVSHALANQRVTGPDGKMDPVRYYINPTGLMALSLSALELEGPNSTMQVTEMDTFSITSKLTNGLGAIEFPIVHGMGFVTAKYSGKFTPLLQSQIGLQSFGKSKSPRINMLKYHVTLFDGASWLIYVSLPEGSSGFELKVNGTNGDIYGTKAVPVTIQIAASPAKSDDYYDKGAGMYPVKGSLSGKTTSHDKATYSIKWKNEGSSVGGTSMMYALPHHLESFGGHMKFQETPVVLDSTTKGQMKGYLASQFDFIETINRDIQFLPWSSAPAFGDGLSYNVSSLRLMAKVANQEIKQDFNIQTNLDSTYYSGKAFDKFSYLLLVINDILKNPKVSKETLTRIQSAFDVFLNNTQQNPLMYDTKVKGITSTAAQKGDVYRDFGSPFYNDHHFHYGYFIHAAAVVAYVDKQMGGNWGETHKDWVNSLIRDVANPSDKDKFFPVFRSFDWFSGHSWAKGMFASADGKDEESTSEDYNFAYGMKLWGKAIGDVSMEARGDLMLAVMKRSMRNYFYMEDNNNVQPHNFIKNKVPGITFENKLDHLTYFGDNIEYIQGIHMIPITPVSSFMRTPGFVQQEYDEKLSAIVPKLDSGWLGLIMLNKALYDPVSSYNFFAQDNFKYQWLDGGVSRTWCLAFAAGVGGAQI